MLGARVVASIAMLFIVIVYVGFENTSLELKKYLKKLCIAKNKIFSIRKAGLGTQTNRPRFPVGVETMHARIFGTSRAGFHSSLSQGCQMVYFQTKNPNLGKFWRAFNW
jgi:hypothetical protein